MTYKEVKIKRGSSAKIECELANITDQHKFILFKKHVLQIL